MPKTVWFIFQEASPIGKGAYSRHYYFAKELLKRGYSPKVITSSFHHFQTENNKSNSFFHFSNEDGIDTVWVGVNKYPYAHSYKRVLAWITFMTKLFFLPFTKIEPPDFIIVSSPSIHSIVGARFLNWYYRSSKLILELRDIWPETLVEVGNISRNNALIRWMYRIEKKAYQKSDYIISTLPFAVERINKVLNCNYYKFKCIPQGISSSDVADETVTYQVKEMFPKDKFIIGYSGTIGASNALETLVKAASIFFYENISDIHFVVIGDGSSLDRLKEMSTGLENISYIPTVSKKYLSKLLLECDVLYDSTKDIQLYKYGLSRNKWIDYMLAGKPMLVSYSGRQTMINEAMNGLVVDSENVDQLKKAILSMKNLAPYELDAMGKRGREFVVNNRSFEKLTDQLVEVLEDC